jgi:hypothetical protein
VQNIQTTCSWILGKISYSKATHGCSDWRISSCCIWSPPKNIELEAKVQKLEEQHAHEAAERDRILGENRQQIREEEQQAKDASKKQITEELRQEVHEIREEMSQWVFFIWKWVFFYVDLV